MLGPCFVVTHVTLLLYFLLRFVIVMPVTVLLQSSLKKGPGGYLIRVDLIRFPGSIPGAIYRCAPTDIH